MTSNGMTSNGTPPPNLLAHPDSPLRAVCPQCRAPAGVLCQKRRADEPHRRRYVAAKALWLDACEAAARRILPDLASDVDPRQRQAFVASHRVAEELLAGLDESVIELAFEGLMQAIEDLRS